MKINQAFQDALARVEVVIHMAMQCGLMPEEKRARIHEMTRTVRMSDEDLENMTSLFASLHRAHDAMLLLKDLRDRYEGLGKYAPAAPEARQEHGEPVKS